MFILRLPDLLRSQDDYISCQMCLKGHSFESLSRTTFLATRVFLTDMQTISKVPRPEQDYISDNLITLLSPAHTADDRYYGLVTESYEQLPSILLWELA